MTSIVILIFQRIAFFDEITVYFVYNNTKISLLFLGTIVSADIQYFQSGGLEVASTFLQNVIFKLAFKYIIAINFILTCVLLLHMVD